MNQKLAALGLSVLLAVGLSACSGNEDESNAQQSTDEPAQTEQTKQQSNLQNHLKKAQVAGDKTVATVNGEEIKGRKYNIYYRQIAVSYQQIGRDMNSNEMKKLVMDTLISEELVLQDAGKKGYKPTKKQVNEEIARMKEQFGGNEKFNQALKQSGLTLSQYKNRLGEQLTMNMYREKEVPEVKVTEEEVKQAYEQAAAGSEKAPKLEEVKSTIKERLKSIEQQKELRAIVEKLKKDSEIKKMI